MDDFRTGHTNVTWSTYCGNEITIFFLVKWQVYVICFQVVSTEISYLSWEVFLSYDFFPLCLDVFMKPRHHNRGIYVRLLVHIARSLHSPSPSAVFYVSVEVSVYMWEGYSIYRQGCFDVVGIGDLPHFSAGWCH